MEQGEFVGMQGLGRGIQLVLLTQGMICLSKRRLMLLKHCSACDAKLFCSLYGLHTGMVLLTSFLACTN